MRNWRKILTNSIRKVIVLLGTQEGDDALYECHRLYFGERKLMLGDAEVNVILAYPDDLIICADESRTVIYASTMTDLELQNFYHLSLWKAVINSQELMDYINTLGYTHDSILSGASQRGEKLHEYLIQSLRRQTGLPKRWLYSATYKLLKLNNLPDEVYEFIELYRRDTSSHRDVSVSGSPDQTCPSVRS